MDRYAWTHSPNFLTAISLGLPCQCRPPGCTRRRDIPGSGRQKPGSYGNHLPDRCLSPVSRVSPTCILFYGSEYEKSLCITDQVSPGHRFGDLHHPVNIHPPGNHSERRGGPLWCLLEAGGTEHPGKFEFHLPGLNV